MVFILNIPFDAFYLTAVTPLGMVSRTEQQLLSDTFSKVILLKGAPPKLQSKLLKQTAGEAKMRGFKVKTALSAVDNDIVEAVFWGDTAVANGSFPFNIEPPFIGSKLYTLWLGDIIGWDAAALKREILSALYSEYKQRFESGQRLLFSADCLLSDNKRTAFSAADECKIKRLATKSADEFISGSGSEKCFVTAGRYGKYGLANSLLGYEVTAFKDSYGGAAEAFLSFIYKQAKRQSCLFYAGFSPLYPYALPELLIFPDSGKAVFHTEGCFKLNRKPDRVITAKRFTDNTILSSRKRMLEANKKTADKLLARSEELFFQAAATQNEILRVAVGDLADGRLLEQPRRRLFDLVF